MNLLRPSNQIFLVTSDSPTELGKAFVRIQEFYESPYKQFRRRHFTLERFKEFYVKEFGGWTYYSDFQGFNVPSNVFWKWLARYQKKLTPDEKALSALLKTDAMPMDFYLIGALSKDVGTINHEISHALFHLYPSYGMTMQDLLKGKDVSGVRKYLKAHMYAEPQMLDEMIAYMMFEHKILNRAGCKTKHLEETREMMTHAFNYYRIKFIKPRPGW